MSFSSQKTKVDCELILVRAAPSTVKAMSLRRLESVFRCYIVCETMEDYKEGCLMV